MSFRIGFWAREKYNLSRMTMPQLVKAYFTHYAVATYFALAFLSGAIAVTALPELSISQALRAIATILAVVVTYPVVWYALHRWVLHNPLMYRRAATAKLWKRIHFDHHQDPHDLGVLFGALYTTLPTIAIIALPIGWLVGGGLSGAATAFTAGLLTTCFYEFCHSAQHLNFRPGSQAIQTMKRLHLLHHFHNENGNHGITNFTVDRLLGTFYASAKDRPKSATAFNLGYDEDVAGRFPWVAAASMQGIRTGTDGRRWQPHTPHADAAAIGADLGYNDGRDRPNRRAA